MGRRNRRVGKGGEKGKGKRRGVESDERGRDKREEPGLPNILA